MRAVTDPPPPAPGVARVLVIKLSALGDLFHALPAVHRLKQEWRATIDWAVHAHLAGVVRCFPDVDRVLAVPRHAPWAPLWPLLRELRRRPYTHILDFQGLLKSAILARLARAPVRLGPAHEREGARWFYTATAGPRRPRRHAVDEALDLTARLGLPRGTPQFPVAFPPVACPEPPPRVALVPCSRWPTKNWAPERFAEVGRALRAEFGAALFLVGGPADRDACARLAAGLGGAARDCSGRTSLEELGGLLQAMDLVVSVDSGPMHMAAALGRPVLAVFGATDPARTGPYGPGHRVVTLDGLDCRPCHARACRRGDLACLAQLDAAPVLRAAREMLAARGRA